MSSVKLVCGQHDQPRYLGHIGTTGPSGRLGLLYVPTEGSQGIKRKATSVESRPEARMYEWTCCETWRLTEAHTRILYEAGQHAEGNTVDLPAFVKALPYYRK